MQQKQQSEEDAAQAGATEETLLALRLLVVGGAGLRHPLHGHAYARYTALRPRVCHACQGAILGPFSKACQCLSCGIVVHRACVMRVPKAPCGSYRGLRDPDGRRSLPLEAQEAAAAAAAGAAVTEQETAAKARARARASPSPVQSLLRAAKPASVKVGTPDGTPGRQSGEDGEQESESITGVEPAAAAAAAAMERRSMTYEALAMVGRLVGTMVGSSSSSSSFSSSPPASASAGLAMPPPPPPGSPKEGGGGSGGFGFATLRSGARAIAGAYAGYTSRAQQEEEAAEASATGMSHLQAVRLMGLGRGLGGAGQPNNSVATAWSQLAQRVLREGAAGEGLLDFAAFVRHLEALEVAEAAMGAVFDDTVGVSPSSGSAAAAAESPAVIETPDSGGSHHHGSGKRGGLIADILRSQRTAPGFLWAACLGRFRRRHEPPESEPAHADELEPSTDDSLLPPAPASQDAAAIIHEVALVLVDFVPGLLTPSCHLALEAYEEAFGAVEGMVMATLAPYVLAECGQRTAALTAAVEGWYASRPPSRDEEEGEEGDHGAALEKAAAELRALAQECTGPRKVRRVLRCCLALGEGLQGSNRVMTADELLPALGKAVRRAAVPALPAHLAFVEETCDTGALLGAEGYALTSLQVVVSLIVQPPPSESERGCAQAGERSQPEEQDAAALVDR